MRTVDVVRALRDSEPVSVDALAERFGVSARTVRFHIHQSNERLGSIARISFVRRRAGYVMEVFDQEALDAWIKRSTLLAGGDVCSARSERVAYLLNDLLQRNDWVTINTLSNLLFVSPQSVSGDLRAVKDVVERFGLALEARPRYGVRITGPEMPRRLCLASIVSKALVTGGPMSWDNNQGAVVEKVATCIHEVLTATDFSIGYAAFQNLTVHICVAIARLRDDAVIPLDEQHLQALLQTEEFPIAQAIADRVGEAFDVRMPETEVAYIAIHLAGKKTLTQLVGASPGVADTNAISDEVWGTVGAMLDRVWDSFHIDFLNDIELRMNLARHLVPLAARLTYGLRLENPLLADIKARYPFAYSIAVEASTVLSKRYEAKVSEDEIGYLALAFALALERQRTGASKKNVLMVCASGVGTARMLEHRFYSAFEGYIDNISTCDVHEVKNQDFSTIDYVFTTVPIGVRLPVPVCEIGYFFDEGDTGNIHRLLRARTSVAGLSARFDRELFFAHLSARTKREVIEFLAARMEERMPLDEGFVASVLAREEAAATSFGNLVAMPHPLNAASDTTCVCVGLLDEPVLWGTGDLPVQAVFLISYARSGGRELDDFFSALADVFMDVQAIERLVKNQAWDVLVSILEGR